MKLVFSLTAHQRPEVILDQIINYTFFNPGCSIVIHFNPVFDWNSDYLTEEEFWKGLELFENVYPNPNRIRCNRFDLLQAHISNFRYISEILDFDYFVMSASNDLFVKFGAEKFIQGYSAGFDYFNIKDRPEWLQSPFARNDLTLYKIIQKIGAKEIYGSQFEGSFFKKDLMKEIFDIIDSEFDYNDLVTYYAREELYMSTVAVHLLKPEEINKVMYCQFGGYDEQILTDILTNKLHYCNIKGVAREMKDIVRTYTRESLGRYKQLEADLFEELSGKRMPIFSVRENKNE